MSVRLDAPARRALVAHEMAHVGRRGLCTGWIEMLLAAAWWWYPPALRVCREMSAAAEEACDRWVLSLYPEQRRSYVEVLYAVAAAHSGPAVPRLVHPLSARSIMERRLEGMARDRRAPRTRRIERVMVLMGALVVLPAGFLAGSASPLTPDEIEMAGILGLGDVRVTSDGAPGAEDDGWIVAFRTDADGGFRAAFATEEGATVVNGTGARTAVEVADRRWIKRVVHETRWSVVSGSRLTSSGALVPAGPHVHLASEGRTLAVWSGVAVPFAYQGHLGAEASEARPVGPRAGQPASPCASTASGATIAGASGARFTATTAVRSSRMPPRSRPVSARQCGPARAGSIRGSGVADERHFAGSFGGGLDQGSWYLSEWRSGHTADHSKGTSAQ